MQELPEDIYNEIARRKRSELIGGVKIGLAHQRG